MLKALRNVSRELQIRNANKMEEARAKQAVSAKTRSFRMAAEATIELAELRESLNSYANRSKEHKDFIEETFKELKDIL
mgnify:FL=1